MKTQAQTIGNALLTAKEVLTQMVAQGFGEAKHVFGLTKMIAEKYSLTESESIIVVEEAMKLV